jgi:16S rRNA (uracil1498-N3)-methyltransferase
MQDGDLFVVRGEERRHLAVLRVRPGERFLATDGEGRELLLETERVSRSELAARIVEERSLPPGPGHGLTLAVAPPKGARMDIAVEKATECGVGRIVPLSTERSVVRGRDASERVARWLRIAGSATAQSGRSRVPEVAPFTSLADALDAASAGRFFSRFAPDSRSIAAALAGARAGEPVTVLVGPEGGFTEAETELARRRGALAVSLGPNRLRTETAAVVAVALSIAALEGAATDREES